MMDQPLPYLRTLSMVAVLLLCGSLFAVEALAQTGQIRGRVTDATTGEALIGVNVFLEGTTVGTATDANGTYIIIGVRPGTYTLAASYIGYHTARVENIRVQIDLSTLQDFRLREESIMGEEVVVTAERPMVQRDLTATTAIVSGEQIRALPVENFQQVVNLQAGVVNGHFRGGRHGEVGYWIDGMPVTDVFDGSLGAGIENNIVEEVQVVTGAFNAEYGQAMSGIVNVVTRDGGNRLQGGFSGFTGDYHTRHDNLFRNLNGVRPLQVQNLEADVSGPIVRERLFFFVSGRYFRNDGWLYGQRVFGFDDVGFTPDDRVDLLVPGGSGDSTFVSMNPFERLSGQAKLTWQALRNVRVQANFMSSMEDFQNYDHGLVFHPDANLNRGRTSQTLFGKVTHALSPRTFYDIGFTSNRTTYEHALFDLEDEGLYRDNRFFDGSIANTTKSYFVAGGTNAGRFSRSTVSNLVKADLTSQINNYNMVKLGVEFRHHELNFLDRFHVVETGTDGDDLRFLATNAEYTFRPIEASAYIQDKVELGTLIVNVGLRADYFDARGGVLADPRDRRNFYDLDDLRPRYTLEEATVPSDPKWQLSPRLGVAFPITAGGVVHFSYGFFFQTPNYELLYRNPFFNVGRAGSGLVGLMGNANLNPERTINGEVGLKQELSRQSAIEVTMYFRDIRDLTGTATDPIAMEGGGERYGMLINSDFGFVRGVVLRFNQRMGTRFFLNTDYTFQIAKGNASDPAQAYSAAAAKQQLEKQIVSLNWDQRHTINVSGSYVGPGDWGFGFIASAGSGLPYTPSQTVEQTGTQLPTTIPLNSETRPFTWNVDLNAFKDFTFGRHRAQVFGRVDNLFDTANEHGVFGDTGRATYTLQRNVDARNFVGPRSFLDAYYTRPDFFSQPRRVVVGMSYRF
jgi:outer membrane receptor protein involved in Fe transport